MNKLNSVLLVDDDPITNYVNKRMLESVAVTDKVMMANNGKEALHLLYQQIQAGSFPDLIFLDINMPVMSGGEFIESYKQIDLYKREAARLVVLTTSSHPRDLECFKDLPTSFYINKPLTKEKLADVLTRYFEFG